MSDRNERIDTSVRGYTDPLTARAIKCAIEVHKQLGAGLMESSYEECLTYEVKEEGLEVKRQLVLPVKYKGIILLEGSLSD